MSISIRAIGRHVSPAWLLAGADALLAGLALALAALLRFAFDLEAARDMLGPILPRSAAFAFWMVVGMLSMGMYRARQRPRFWEMVARIMVATLIGGFAYVLFFYLVPDVVTGRGVLALTMAITAVVLSVTHWYLLRLADFNPAKSRVLVLGAGRAASKVGQLRRRADRRRFDVVGYVPASPKERSLARELGLGPLVELESALAQGRVDRIVVALDDRRGTFPTSLLLEQKFAGTPVVEVVEFLERETERIDLDVLNPAWLVFSASGHAELPFRATKRVFDLLVSTALLVLTAPLFLLVTLAILVEDGPRSDIFYRQARVGKNGRVFMLLKFRSMVADAEADGGARWSTAGDSRVTRIGRLIRRFRVDELPQVLNVLRGEMSVVGPRPERPEFVEQLTAEVPLYDYRHCVRPGLTGWAQLNFPYGASVEDAREKLKYDLYYIKNADVVFDVFVLLQTVEVVLWGKGTSMAGQQPGPDAARRADTAEQLEMLARRKQDAA